MGSTARHVATTVLGLVLLAACTAPAASTLAPLGSIAPNSTELLTPEPDRTASGTIDLGTLTGRIVFDDSQDIWAIKADGTGLTRVTQEPWREFDPTLSHDGTLIAYRSEPNDYPELWLMNADGSDQHRWQAEGGFPAWSRDGSMLAYAPPGGPSGQSWIAVMNADGSGLRRLPDTELGEYPAWSPDGKRIAFSAARSRVRVLYIVDVDGSRIVDLSGVGEGSHPAWSPDGSSILFASHRGRSDNYRDIYSMRPDGSEVTRLTPDPGEMPAWSPDGRYIVFAALGGLAVARADGCCVTRLPTNGVAFAGFPDWR